MKRLLSVAILCLVGACLSGCDVGDAMEQAGYIPIDDACEYCECPLDVGGMVDDLIDDILDGKRSRIEDPDWDE